MEKIAKEVLKEEVEKVGTEATKDTLHGSKGVFKSVADKTKEAWEESKDIAKGVAQTTEDYAKIIGSAVSSKSRFANLYRHEMSLFSSKTSDD